MRLIAGPANWGFFFLCDAVTEPDYILVNRRLRDHKIWTKEPFTQGQAWVDLLMLARWMDGEMLIRGVTIQIKRGQVGWSIKGLAQRWHWSQGKVKRFIKYLKTEDQIRDQISNVTTVLTIVNYDKYQINGEQNGDQTETKRRPNGDQTETKEEREEGKQGKERKKNTGLELPKTAASKPAVGINPFPIVGNPKEWLLAADKLTEWTQTYEHLDVPVILREARQWLMDNPKRRKTAHGMVKFLGAWLARTQERGRGLQLDDLRNNKIDEDQFDKELIAACERRKAERSKK